MQTYIIIFGIVYIWSTKLVDNEREVKGSTHGVFLYGGHMDRVDCVPPTNPIVIILLLHPFEFLIWAHIPSPRELMCFLQTLYEMFYELQSLGWEELNPFISKRYRSWLIIRFHWLALKKSFSFKTQTTTYSMHFLSRLRESHLELQSLEPINNFNITATNGA